MKTSSLDPLEWAHNCLTEHAIPLDLVPYVPRSCFPQTAPSQWLSMMQSLSTAGHGALRPDVGSRTPGQPVWDIPWTGMESETLPADFFTKVWYPCLLWLLLFSFMSTAFDHSFVSWRTRTNTGPSSLLSVKSSPPTPTCFRHMCRACS